MASKRADVVESGTEPNYVGWRGELLAELALSRIPRLIVTKHPDRPTGDAGFDFLVATEKGFCFFVDVRAFSSARLKISQGDPDEDWNWRLDATIVRRARESRSPFVLFLFDADTDSGRFLRLDTLCAPNQGEPKVPVRLPAENTINKENLEKMIAALELHRGS